MQPYTYLLINIFAVLICFIFSFHRRIRFDRHFLAFTKACIVVGTPFIIWDVWFTKANIWWFNYNFTLGFKIAGLPLEELLFFVCIPFSCVFTYFCLDKFFELNWANAYSKVLVWLTVAVCITVALVYRQRAYPMVTGLVTAATVLYLYYVVKINWLGKASLVYLFLMPGFFIVNGMLTGTGVGAPIVNYNVDEILNVRMLSIPIEDSVYGYSLFMLNLHFFSLFKKEFKDPIAATV